MAHNPSSRRSFVWPFINLLIVMCLLSRKLGTEWDLEPPPPPPLPKCIDLEDPSPACPQECNGNGMCQAGICICYPSWSDATCSTPQCPYNCSGQGTCLEGGICLCNRERAGTDCRTQVDELQIDKTLSRLGVPFTEQGHFEDDVELVMTSRSTKRYGKQLCRTPACMQSWESALNQVSAFLPKEDPLSKYRTCAVVSSARHLVPKSLKEEARGEHTPHGQDIDKHAMILRLDNAPTAGFEKWVGSRTTHRLVQGDYAHLVHSMLGTEVVVNQTKSVVTPSTWWAGGYPVVEKVTYMMAVNPIAGRQQLKPPEHNGYAPFTEVFPGSKRVIVSPVFMKRVLETHERVREVVRQRGLGCYKNKEEEFKIAPLYLATLMSLQMCNRVSVYGVQVGGEAVIHSKAAQKVHRDKQYRIRSRTSHQTECCYYPQIEGYSMDTEICDEISRRHALRYLQESGRLQTFE